MGTVVLNYLFLALFIGLILFFWGLNFVGAPGNWLIIASAALWNWVGPESFRFSWWWLVGLILLAVVGEVLEFAASVMGTRKMGGSSRGATLSVVGSIVGGLLGVLFGIPIPVPVVGMLISGVLFASLGALAGAMIGEYSLGTSMEQSTKIGLAAGVGRMLGTFGKIIMGAAIVALMIIVPFLSVWT
jgi:uncharacterized protein